MAVTLLVTHASLEQHALPHRWIKMFHGEAGQLHWGHTREQVIDHITNQLFNYFIQRNGRAVRIVLDRLPDGEWFMRTEMDDDLGEALLQLPAFEPSHPHFSAHE